MAIPSNSPSDYLIVEDREMSSKWHLQVMEDGTPNHRLMGAAWAALHGGFRGNKYEGPNKEQAITKLKRLYASEKMNPPGEYSMFVIDEFVNVKAGDPYRLLPFGVLVKGGKRRNITPEIAATFKLPHFKPAIKLGSHDDTTPAGGSIIALEVRQDGLYAVPEFTDKGAQAITDGSYRYHSPEILWEGELENPADGSAIKGPLIIGDALLHTPHLGEAAALYSIEITPTIREGVNENMSQVIESVNVPKGLWDRFELWFKRQTEPVTEPPAPPEIPDEYKAALKERDVLAARVADIEKATALKARVENFGAQLKATKLDGIAGAAEMLSSMSDEQAAWVVTQVKALSEQANLANLDKPQGSNQGGPDNPMEALSAAIAAKQAELKIEYKPAYEIVKAEKPELFRAAYGKEK